MVYNDPMSHIPTCENCDVILSNERSISFLRLSYKSHILCESCHNLFMRHVTLEGASLSDASSIEMYESISYE